jgi:N-acetylglucosaminyl-diphospho-decaprenol L-rhamnosyltransferase
MADVTFIIVAWESREVIPSCLASIDQQDYDGEVEVIVWDNDSDDRTLDAARSAMPSARLLPSSENVGFAQGNNGAAGEATGALLVFLNPDTVIPQTDALRRWVAAHDLDENIGISAPRLLNSDGTVQPSVAKFTSPSSTLVLGLGLHKLMRGRLRDRWAPHNGSPSVPGDVDWVKGAAVMISMDLFTSVGGWDEGAFMYAEDQDLCWMVRQAGYRVFFDPAIEIIHLDDHAANKRWSDVERTTRVANATVGMVQKRYGRRKANLTLRLLAFRYGIRAFYFRARGEHQAAERHLASARVFARAGRESP